jgi:uncharacterized membrane protein YoaK (UPF0700 family)
MLYGNESISQYRRSNIIIWMLMAFQAGSINIGAFMACHQYVSHVTGFATAFAAEIDSPTSHHILNILIVPFFFLLGAMISGQLIDYRSLSSKRPRYYVTFGVIFALTAIVFGRGVAGYLGTFGEVLEPEQDYFILTLLSLVCGIQNGTITTVSRSVIRTTHLTGVTTDLGIGLVRVFHRDKFPERASDEVRANLMRIGIILFFVFGAIVGGVFFRQYGYYGFAIPLTTSGVLFLLMIFFQLRKAVTP